MEGDQKLEANDFETRADEFFSKSMEADAPGESSDAKQAEGKEDTTKDTATAEVDKTEQVKEVESDRSLSPEERIAKIKELLGDDEKALDAYIKQKGYHQDPAWQKQREIIEKLKQEGKAASSISAEDKAALEEFNKFRSSPDYIKMTMKSQGFTEEAINKKLVESGHEVSAKTQDDVDLVINKLGISLDNMSDVDRSSVRANISDVSKIARILIDEALVKTLPKELAPYKENIETIKKTEHANKMLDSMKGVTKKEGILDFEKDIEPLLNQFIDDNPDTTQPELLEHFKEVSRSLTIERLKSGKKQEERDEKKSNLRQNIPLSRGSIIPKRTGNFEKDADAFFSTLRE